MVIITCQIMMMMMMTIANATKWRKYANQPWQSQRRRTFRSAFSNTGGRPFWRGYNWKLASTYAGFPSGDHYTRSWKPSTQENFKYTLNKASCHELRSAKLTIRLGGDSWKTKSGPVGIPRGCRSAEALGFNANFRLLKSQMGTIWGMWYFKHLCIGIYNI